LATKKQLTVHEEELLWAISAAPLVPVLIYTIVFHISVISSSFEDAIRYSLVVLVLYLFATCGIYEVASSFKMKKTLWFRVKRFLSRSTFVTIYVLCFYGLWSFFTLLFSSVLKMQYILLFSLLTLSFVILVLVQNPRTRRLIKKLTQEETSHRK
jgi:uncharacterized membrane protein